MSYNPYVRALAEARAENFRKDEARGACTLLIAAYAKDHEAVDWADVQAALGAAMRAFGMEIHDDGRSLVLLAQEEGEGRRRKARFTGRDGPYPRSAPAGVEWWFLDETDDEMGPYPTLPHAYLAMAAFLDHLNHGPENLDLRLQRMLAEVLKPKRGGDG